jgi:hypothetical protein
MDRNIRTLILIPGASTVCIISTVTGLVMKGNTDIVTMVEARASSESLLHGWVRTGGACKICISTNWCGIASTSGEIVIKRSNTSVTIS